MSKKNNFYFQIVSAYRKHKINLPQRQTNFSAGYDLEAVQNIIIKPQEIVLVPTGIKAHFEKNKVLLIYARSSLALKKGVMLANNVGVIDSDYYNNEQNEGHILISLYNFSNQEVIIHAQERIAQAILQDFYLTDNENHQKENKVRKNGFGSTN